MNGRFLYLWVLASASGERMEAIQALSHASLCRLADFLIKDHTAGETSGDVLGMCLVEQADRFARQWREQVVPATNEEGIL
jgi:hypothetical protein